MSSTSQKHRNFVSEPMRDKPVTELPGVGPKLGGKLEISGCGKARDVLGQYLVRKQPEQFDRWMHNKCGANKKQSQDCYGGLSEWSKEFL